MNQFVGSIVGWGSHEDGPLGGIVGERAWGDPGGTQFAQRKHGRRLDVLRKVV